jgi:hypothetical protein
MHAVVDAPPPAPAAPATPAAPPPTAPAAPILKRLALALGFAALADVTLRGGVSLAGLRGDSPLAIVPALGGALAAAALAMVAVVGVGAQASRLRRALALAAGLAMAAGLAVDVSTLSLTMALLAAPVAAASAAPWRGPRAWLRRAVLPTLSAPFAAPTALAKEAPRHLGEKFDPREWLLPFGLLALFGALLSGANERLAASLGQLWSVLAGFADGPRALLLIGAAMLAFAYLARRPAGPDLRAAASTPPDLSARGVFGRIALMRAGLALNALFLVHFIAAFAPSGSLATLSDRAQSGAYLLIVTAVLAGVLALAADRRGAAAASPLLRALILGFLAQNVALALMATAWLQSYVDAYGLTWWRFSSFVWFALTSVGLILTAVKIQRGRDGGWLIAANAVALGMTLTVLLFVDAAGLIARHNLSQRRLAAGAPIDVSYAESLGVAALPALSRALGSAAVERDPALRKKLAYARARLEANLRDAPAPKSLLSPLSWRERRLRAIVLDADSQVRGAS